jgi:membrane-bound lytic murein transglycosylase A
VGAAARATSGWPTVFAVCILGLLAACISPPPAPATPTPTDDKPTVVQPTPSAPPPAGAILRPRARWVPVEWAELPGWQADRTLELWPALVRGCERPAPGWASLCIAAGKLPPQSDADARAWLQQQLRPYRVEALDGAADGLITGYIEARIEARRRPSAAFRVPIYAPPADLASRQPYWTRQQLDTLPAAKASLAGRELAYVADPLDALFLQIQGSGRVLMTEPDGSRQLVRLTYAGHNGQPYKSVGKWLIEQGEIRADQASWPDIKQWAQSHPRRINELLWSNPRVVFFREEALTDPLVAPVGAQGVPLTPRRSIAVDAQSIPYGTPVWLDTSEPLSNQPLRRLVMAQDTGSAIIGAVRADFFWGWGDEAEAQAGRMKQPLRLWALWPIAAGTAP